MILEAELENKFLSELSSIPEISSCQFIGSRQIGPSDEDGIKEKDNVDTIVAVHTNYRQHDNFSLSPISVPMAIQITTRFEKDVDSSKHEAVVEKISDKLAYWHKFSSEFTDTFQLEKMFCGEIRMTGGSGRSFDDNNRVWTETISFIIRGSERFIKPQTMNGKWGIWNTALPKFSTYFEMTVKEGNPQFWHYIDPYEPHDERDTLGYSASNHQWDFFFFDQTSDHFYADGDGTEKQLQFTVYGDVFQAEWMNED